MESAGKRSGLSGGNKVDLASMHKNDLRTSSDPGVGESLQRTREGGMIVGAARRAPGKGGYRYRFTVHRVGSLPALIWLVVQ